MHSAVLVFGDVDSAMEQVVAETEADWWAIGGRFTGRLLPREGAGSGRIHGDAVPEFEATVTGELGISRPLAGTDGPGVDQVRLSELAGAWGEFFFVATPGELMQADEELILDSLLLDAEAGGTKLRRPVDRARHQRRLREWHQRIAVLTRRLRREGDPLVSVVDLHV